jgi:hypothetical protein
VIRALTLDLWDLKICVPPRNRSFSQREPSFDTPQVPGATEGFSLEGLVQIRFVTPAVTCASVR